MRAGRRASRAILSAPVERARCEWTAGGDELVYFEPPEMRKVVSIRRSPSFQVSAPRDLFATTNPQGSDVTRDGLRMLLNVRTAETAPTPITLVLDWTAGLKK